MRIIPSHNTPRPTEPSPATSPGLIATRRHPAAAIMDDPITAGVLHSAWSGDPAVIVPSPPGAGKTRLVALLAASLAHRADLRVGIAAQTRAQAIELARRLGAIECAAKLIWPARRPRPSLSGAATVVHGTHARFQGSGGGVLVATTARWTYASPRDLACDVMVVDEAWQATYSDLGALGAFAAQIVCVGDPGQIAPVVTGKTNRWDGSPTGPHLPAPEALLAAHGDTVSVVTLRHTWRLGPHTTALVQPTFYPDLPFTSRRPPEHLIEANRELPEVSAYQVAGVSGPTDPRLLSACADQTRALLRTTRVHPEGTHPLTSADLAVVVAHVSQAAAVRAMLSDLPDLLVGTANQMQGMERPATVVLHPLAGYRDVGTFGADPGRACVMFSRHRAHMTVITDSATPALLAGPTDDLHVAAQRELLTALAPTDLRL